MDPDHPHHRLPVVKRTISFSSPRSVLLLNPTLPLVLCLFGIAIVFTVWPTALDHAPIGFERRGVIHHIWHYSLLGGSLLALYGMFSANLRRLQFEFAGLLLLVTALSMNFVAQMSVLIAHGESSVQEGVTGLGLALRVAVIATLALRAGVLVVEPVVIVPGTNPDNGEE
jgi:hypothetical protein